MTRAAFRLGPIARLALGLAALSVTLLMIGDFLFGVTTNDALIIQQLRKRLTETAATQAIVLIERDDEIALGKTLNRLLTTNPDMHSIGIRRTDGSLYSERGEHRKFWRTALSEGSSLNQVSVPIYANQSLWGHFEISFVPRSAGGLTDTLGQPMLLMILLMAIGGFAIYYAYLKRAMHYLDPSSAIPERVHKAFDTLADALLVLDAEGRILLANRAFQQLNRGPVKLGSFIADIPWLQIASAGIGALGAPWDRTLKEQISLTDVRMHATSSDGRPLELSVSCSLIRDENDSLRGCLVSLTDQSELERTNDQLRDAISEIEHSRARIKAQNEKLQYLASRDPLTGCLNRRAFFDSAAPKFANALRTNGELCCVMSDIDHFKSFNDLYGHSVGDQVIRAVATNIERQLRHDDLLCRYGGEEFVIVLVGITALEAFTIAERMRLALEKGGSQSIRDTEVRQITSSFGIASITDGAKTIEQLIEHADIALYASKENGRNRTTIWTPAMKGD